MKKTILRASFLSILALALFTKANAQVSVNLNVGLWNPPAEYSGVDYYYVPDIESYYYVPKHQYVYLDGGNWVWRNTPPPRYGSFNINNGYKVAVNRPQAYRYFTTDRVKYAKYKGNKKQVIVRNNYYNNNTRVVKVKHDNGNHNGWGNGRGNGGGKGHGGGNGHGHGKH
ncbi:hypothetical protein DYU05_04995 [Mucilaginibacter terrenus]|uniref:DUF3300 domain-containing protein n=1 Tax=Mucilaginibacter terrenus TaxID=2482727 RepID=A0A3E2NVB8_9SPHI|nr:hypothetical protein [Mucilaginibacter terrenus]RFZ84966.1 hypothetical protein DYU05_04995 [Mucilaginibacter terrenus]